MNSSSGNGNGKVTSVAGTTAGGAAVPPLASGVDANRQASYRSISRMTVPSRSSSASQVYRGFAPSQMREGASLAVLQASSSTSAPVHGAGKNQQASFQDPFLMSTQSANSVAIKVAAAVAPVTTQSSKCLAREYPVHDFPLSKTNVTIKDPAQLDSCLRVVCKSLEGVLKPAKGCVRARMPNSTDVKVCAYRDSKSGKIVLEFNRLDGCAFTFQKAFVQAKLDAVTYLDSVDKANLEAELLSIEKKLSFWYGTAGTDALAALTTGAGGMPIAIGNATAV